MPENTEFTSMGPPWAKQSRRIDIPIEMVPLRPITVFDFEEAIGDKRLHVAIRGIPGLVVGDEHGRRVFEGPPKDVLEWLRKQP